MGYYYDEGGNIKEELLDTKAKEQAEKFISYYFNRRKNREEIDNKNTLTSAQLRRFYGEFKQLQKKVETKGFDSVKPHVKMVKSKASYAANPENRKIPDSFKDFLINNINKIDTEKDFKAFMHHFEAVVGFFYGMGVKNN